MASNPQWYAAAVTAAATLLNGGGNLVIYAGSQPTAGTSLSSYTVLATLPLSSTAFGSASGTPPVATANAITTVNASATGTAGFFALVESGGTVVMTGSVGTSAADLILSSVSLVSGSPVAVTGFTITG
jgi:hypothetical protein